MTHDIRDITRERIIVLDDDKASLTAKIEGIDSEMERLRLDRDSATRQLADVMREAKVTRQALAMLEEQLSGQAEDAEIEVPAHPPVQPDPVPPTPTPVASPAPAPTPAKKQRGTKKDPLSVGRSNRAGVKGQEGIKRPRVHDKPVIDLEGVTSTWIERAEAVYLLLEQYGSMSQLEIREKLPEIIDGFDVASGAPFVTKCIEVLRAQDRVIWQGVRRNSAIWKAATTAAERASAGLGCDDGNFAGRTTHPPDRKPAFDGPGKVAVDSSAFEQGKRR